MTKPQFRQLVIWLRWGRHLEDTRYQFVEQKLMIYLWILAFGEPQRNAAHRFRIAQSTVSAIFHSVTAAMIVLYQEFVQLPPDGYVAPEVELDPKACQFNGCIGALDGTLTCH
jgi:hypothetical protein